MKHFFLAAPILLFATSANYAADLTEPTVIEAPALEAASPAPVATWSGMYVGGQVGYGWGDADYHYMTDGPYNMAPGETVGNQPKGWLGGVQAGYNWQRGAAVFGLEASAQAANVHETIVGPFGWMDRINTSVDWVAAITPRVGVASNDWMVYGKGGVAFADITARLDDVNEHFYDERSKTVTGWTLGAGVEKMVTSKVSLGVEGNYYDFGKIAGGAINSVNGDGTQSPWMSDHRVNTSMFNAVVRLNYKFGE